MNSTYCLIFLMKPSRTMTQTLCLTLSARISYRTNRTVHNEYSAAARACETYLRRASRSAWRFGQLHVVWPMAYLTSLSNR